MFFGSLALLLLALVIPGLVVAARPLGRWSRATAAALGLQALLLLAFLPLDDSYRRDGTSNWSAYDIELAAVPGALAMLGAAVWLLRRPTSRAAGAFGPVAALLGSAVTIVSLLLTAN